MSDNFRQLYIIRGPYASLLSQVFTVINQLDGDWIVLTDNRLLSDNAHKTYSFHQAKQLLGQEFTHAVFDATDGFNLDAFAILSGTLVAGSVLILLLPETFSQWQDRDSLRWNESDVAINPINFTTYLNSVIECSKDNVNIFFNKINMLYYDFYLIDLIKENKKTTKMIYNQCQEQKSVLEKLTHLSHDIVLLTAKRGRGKSALAGMFSQQQNCWITAPNQAAITTFRKFADRTVAFYAPDELIHQIADTQQLPDWLIIDEAAMIPLPMLEKLLQPSYRVLLTTTMDGYEGTGQGLLLKLFHKLEKKRTVTYYQLNQPIRWQDNDPLEQFTERLLVINRISPTGNNDFSNDIPLKIVISELSQRELVSIPNTLFNVFNLLRLAHYQTSLVDLRRLLDASNLKIYIAKNEIDKHNAQIIGTLLTIREGGLSDELVQAVWQGIRRPKGNLVAQSLVAHAGEPLAGTLTSIRVNRIAVNVQFRKQGVAKQLITKLIEQASIEKIDFISVSFAYSLAMYQFWQNLGFTVVHIGSHKDSRSGCYSAMAIFPLSQKAVELTQSMAKKLARNWLWYQRYIEIELPITVIHDVTLTDDDKQHLIGFATTYHSYEATLPALHRLMYYLPHIDEQQAPILNKIFRYHQSRNEIIKTQQLPGKKALIQQLRQEIKQVAIKAQWII